MNGGYSASFTLMASVIARLNRKKARKKIERLNERNRRVRQLGGVRVSQLFPENGRIGSICISGGSETVRNALILQNCRQSVGAGMPTIVLHEGNLLLEQTIRRSFLGHGYLRVVNASDPCYDPIFRLNDVEIGHFVSEASPDDHRIDARGALYVKTLAFLLRRQGISPYTRMFAHCPHGSIGSVIDVLERSGKLNAGEAKRARKETARGAGAHADMDYYFQQLELESPVLAWKRNLPGCTSIAECIRRKGILTIDLGSAGRRYLLDYISTEIEWCARTGIPFRLVVDAACLPESGKLMRILKNTSGALLWTLSSPDLDRTFGSAPGQLSALLSLSDRAVLLSHGIRTSEKLSAELGEYECIEIDETRAGQTNIGRIGLHYGASSGFRTSAKRKPVVAPEEIGTLGSDGFILLDNDASTLGKGRILQEGCP